MGLNLNSEDELTSWSLKQTNVSSGSDEEMLESMEDDIRNVKQLIIKRGCGTFDCINCAYIFLQGLHIPFPLNLLRIVWKLRNWRCSLKIPHCMKCQKEIFEFSNQH